jgi:BirA family biotin operon repressor/biotin-[acetyl-CoA-carboxylase] ligase
LKIQKLKEAGYPGRVYWYEQVESTNTTARQLAGQGAGEWTAVAAFQQTAGRGRYQRRWVSPAGKGMYLSVVLRPRMKPTEINLINLSTALLVADFLEKQANAVGTPLAVGLKWPNDVLVNQRKIAGILLETGYRHQQVDFVVVGVGINLNHTESDFPEELRHLATSLLLETGKEWEVPAVATDFLIDFHRGMQPFLSTHFAHVLESYRRRLLFRNQTIRVVVNNSPLTGILRDVDDQGFLLLQTDQGILRITSGDVGVGM